MEKTDPSWRLKPLEALDACRKCDSTGVKLDGSDQPCDAGHYVPPAATGEAA